jgi:hypothetical protein
MKKNHRFLNSSKILFSPCQNFDLPLYVHTDGAFSCGDAGVRQTGVASTHARSKLKSENMKFNFTKSELSRIYTPSQNWGQSPVRGRVAQATTQH